MAAQMLIQIPLLVAVGWLAAKYLPRKWHAAFDAWNGRGISGLILATFAIAFWMLPRSLDAAVTEPSMILGKFFSVPLLIGLPLALSWPRMGFILRGFVLAELIAMCFRLGWLYLISPIRLCSNYLLNDQQHTGRYLLLIGAGILVWLCAKLLFGAFASLTRTHTDAPDAIRRWQEHAGR
ncbi:MAG TPA: hypothetical protein VFM15_02970, partial [Gammaproteobacteria bacterium]|nr:hypothetical protein [Gammaproteobacteria bacterium]